jgi:DNA-binding protein H-NS
MSTLAQLQAQIEELERKASQMRAREFDATVKEILVTMQAFGITVKHLQTALADVGKKSRKLPMRSSPVAPESIKFGGPHGETWSGRGRTPKWLVAAERLGRAREEFRIASQQFTDLNRVGVLSIHNEAS